MTKRDSFDEWFFQWTQAGGETVDLNTKTLMHQAYEAGVRAMYIAVVEESVKDVTAQ